MPLINQPIIIMQTRTIKLTHEEIETIKAALQAAYDSQIQVIEKSKRLLDRNTLHSILESANKFLNTQEVFDGERDC